MAKGKPYRQFVKEYHAKMLKVRKLRKQQPTLIENSGARLSWITVCATTSNAKPK